MYPELAGLALYTFVFLGDCPPAAKAWVFRLWSFCCCCFLGLTLSCGLITRRHFVHCVHFFFQIVFFITFLWFSIDLFCVFFCVFCVFLSFYCWAGEGSSENKPSFPLLGSLYQNSFFIFFLYVLLSAFVTIFAGAESLSLLLFSECCLATPSSVFCNCSLSCFSISHSLTAQLISHCCTGYFWLP